MATVLLKKQLQICYKILEVAKAGILKGLVDSWWQTKPFTITPQTYHMALVIDPFVAAHHPLLSPN